MELDLIHGRDRVRLGREPLQVGNLEVRHTDRMRTAVGPELLERPPRRNEVAVIQRRQRPMDKEEIDVVVTKHLERRFESAPRHVRMVIAVVEFARDVNLATVAPRRANCPADTLLIAIHLRRIDMPVPRFQRETGGALCLGRRNLKNTEAKLRDQIPIIQCDQRNGHNAILPDPSTARAARG